MESTESTIWNIARIMRDRVWDAQHDVPAGPFEDDEHPVTDAERHWYLQGKAEAYAAIMSECETMGAG